MSACISKDGEYSEHKLATKGSVEERFICSRCLALDEVAALREIDRLQTTRNAVWTWLMEKAPADATVAQIRVMARLIQRLSEAL